MTYDRLTEILSKRKDRLRDLVSDEEWSAREDLAACYRLCAHYRMTDMIYNHISLRVPGSRDHFLINAFGLLYEEVSASNLVKIDIDGRVVEEIEDARLDINPAGFVIHSAIHKARSDLHCIIHTHTRAGVAIACRHDGLLPVSQHAMRFFNRIGYHDFEGIALNLDEQKRLVRDLGNHNALILRNHGLLTAGQNARDAFDLMYYLEMACQIQVDATANGTDPIIPDSDTCEHCAQQFSASNEGFVHNKDWHALRRMLDRKSPDYRQ